MNKLRGLLMLFTGAFIMGGCVGIHNVEGAIMGAAFFVVGGIWTKE